jgi:phage terminase large subunit-like protein
VPTPGSIVDYAYVRKTLNEWKDQYNVCVVAYDNWNATQLVTELQGDGFTCARVGQTFAGVSAASKSLEARVVSQTILHDGNPVMRWCVQNTVVERDAAGNIKPSKKKSTERNRIDGVVALVMALDALERNPAQTGAWFFDQEDASLFF